MSDKGLSIHSCTSVSPLLLLKPTAIIQLGDKATYDRALSDDVRMFGICWQVSNREIDNGGRSMVHACR